MGLQGKLLGTVNRVLRSLDVQVVRYSNLWHPTATHLVRQPHRDASTLSSERPFLKLFEGGLANSHDSFDFAVVMTTTLRPTIHRALRSIFNQQFDGRVQVLIGVDVPLGSHEALEETCRAVPDRQCVLCLYPGYSTSRRHGGQHLAGDGGALRTVLSYLADSRFVAYLDDDNWWSEDHLASLYQALNDAQWAYSLRWFVHPHSGRLVCKDEWESIGPGRGEFRQYGGWVDPNCLAIDKQACETILPWFSIPMRNSERCMGADRNVFRILSREFRSRATGRYSVFYTVNETDPLHQARLQEIGAERYAAAGHPSVESHSGKAGPEPLAP